MTLVNESAIPVRPAGARPRLDFVDLLRGWIMILMALDHVRDFFHTNASLFEPTDLEKTYPALFLTRWITHFCAPVFFFLAGTGAFLSLGRGKTKSNLSYFLVTRGLWLVLLELTLIKFGWTFNWNLHQYIGQVIWALGWSMVLMAALVHLPLWALTTLGAVMIAGHNLLDGIRPSAFGSFSWLWKVLHVQSGFEILPGYNMFIVYPLIPWLGVMVVGYAFGSVLRRPQAERRRYSFLIGLGLTVAFIFVRALNVYGDPRPWSPQQSFLFTVFSFLNCEKYPPSLSYLLMTLGPAIIFLALFDRDLHKMWRPILVFGRVPLLFYLLHIFVIHALAALVASVRYGKGGGLWSGPPFDPETLATYPSAYGYGLFGVFAAWIVVLLLLYPACKWFADLKQRRRDSWLSYF